MARNWLGWLKRPRGASAGGLLARLRRDRRGNTLAIAAAALIPLAGMVGGGVDMSRMYITKTRLQHACDAGALAGRKSMGGGAWDTNDDATAKRFFDANYQAGAYGSETLSRSFSENNGIVTGTASAVLPLTLMRILGKTSETLAVTCDAAMKLPNTDVMFVLDVTGSMNCVAGDTTCTNNGGVPAPGSKIDGLKVAVKCFYEIVAQEDTDATCTTGTPSGGLAGQTQVRFGFMPYASNVNVGYLLPPAYFANEWKYQSRVRNGSNWGPWGNGYYKSNCSKPADTATLQYRGTATGYGGNYACYIESRAMVPQWDYRQVTTTVSGLKNGTNWRTSFTLPINNDGSDRTITWNGCIEERPTVRTTNFNPIPNNAYDLDIDLVPTQGNANSLWGPSLEDLIYLRDITTAWSQIDTADVTSTDNYYNNITANCPPAATRLTEWPNAAAFDDYVNGLTAQGNTYHDIGMLWGARFMSPTGMFAAANATTPEGGEIQRHMIFMTDGDSTANACDYNAYGVPWLDRRQTTDVGTAGNCPTNRQPLIDQINLRLTALCTAVKNKNITLWVISYGGIGINADNRSRLEACASPGKYFSADNAAVLQSTFKDIANQISQLRLTK